MAGEKRGDRGDPPAVTAKEAVAPLPPPPDQLPPQKLAVLPSSRLSTWQEAPGMGVAVMVRVRVGVWVGLVGTVRVGVAVGPKEEVVPTKLTTLETGRE